MKLFGRVTAGLFIAICIVFATAAARNYWQAASESAQERHMHTLAEQHESHEPPDRWKHDERALIADATSHNNSGTFYAIGAAVVLLGAAWSLRREEFRFREHVILVPKFQRSPLPTVSVQAPKPEPIDPHTGSLANALFQRFYRRVEIGDEGEDRLEALLKPMSDEGWMYIGGRKDGRIQVRYPGYEGDLDFFVCSPTRICFAIDAKNWKRRITYSTKKHALIGKRVGDGQNIHCNLQTASRVAAWAMEQTTFECEKDGVRTTVERGVVPLAVIPVVCFVGDTDVRVMPQIADVYITERNNVVAFLKERA